MTRSTSSADATPLSIAQGVVRVLDLSYEMAADSFAAEKIPNLSISNELKGALKTLSEASTKASSAFTNIVTCLAIKAAEPSLDMRVHQVQIGAPFNFRSVSETSVYPWLDEKSFEGAKSGWQTRTFERPKPYTLDFDENIAHVKEPFLNVHEYVEVRGQSAFDSLVFLAYEQMLLREKKKIPLAAPTIDEIEQIVSYFKDHFFAKYRSKGASRLPVLAIYAVYEVMIGQIARYEGKSLRPLQRHSAADAQTGAVGDIEVQNDLDQLPFEAVEIKHDQEITDQMIEDAAKKIAPYQLDRYYLLTTAENCRPSSEQSKKLQQIKLRLGSQLIVNGVIPSLRYYLRLMRSPNAVFPIYARLLNEEKQISHEHRVMWSKIVTDIQ